MEIEIEKVNTSVNPDITKKLRFSGDLCHYDYSWYFNPGGHVRGKMLSKEILASVAQKILKNWEKSGTVKIKIID